jgi:hypothetical protein
MRYAIYATAAAAAGCNWAQDTLGAARFPIPAARQRAWQMAGRRRYCGGVEVECVRM